MLASREGEWGVGGLEAPTRARRDGSRVLRPPWSLQVTGISLGLFLVFRVRWIEHTAESSQSAPGPRGTRLGEERREGWPAGGSGIAKCVSDLGPSLFHKHLALRKLPAALRGL